ncbi:MAG: glycosyltransferase family 4 protein [Clostridia bacterium]|nr:glycosyltransferase family 4 protein [Clostridia bacterium]
MYESDMGIVMRFLNRILLSNVNKAIVLSESLKNSFEGILPKHKIEIVSNCIDDEIFISEYEFDEKLQSIDCLETVNILFLSNMIESKGYRTVLEISKICKENRLEEYRFIFAGGFFSKADEEYFFDFTKKHQLSETVEYKGIVTGLEKRELLRGSHVFILPTNYNKEGQPISIIEAMADGMCIITTKHAGIPDLVTDRENGFLVPYGDYKKMYDKIREISSDRGKLKEIYLNNRDKVKKYFLQEHYIKNLEKLFDDELI